MSASVNLNPAVSKKHPKRSTPLACEKISAGPDARLGTPNPSHVSPKRLARAAGVSESSVKRWCDQGKLGAVKTEGGHRRVSLEVAREFLRASGRDADFSLLGLPARKGTGERTRRNLLDDYYRSLVAGDASACREILFERHLAGERASRVLDEIVAPAFHRLGAAWCKQETQVYQERRACGLCWRQLDEWKSWLSPLPESSPLAVGGAAEGDFYFLPTAMVELTLTQRGWRAHSLGSNLPFSTLLAAVHDFRPRVVWLSVSHVENRDRFLREYGEFQQSVESIASLVVGGRALTPSIRRQMRYASFCDRLVQLEDFAHSLAKPELASAGQERRARRKPYKRPE